MFSPLLFVHSWVRWLVLLAGVALGGRVLVAWRRGREWNRSDSVWTVIFGVVFTVQILVGILLYMVSPLPQASFALGALFVKNRVLRFYTIEHITTMVGAWLLFLNSGFVILRGPPEGRPRRMGILLLVVLGLVLAAIPWPGLLHGRPLHRPVTLLTQP